MFSRTEMTALIEAAPEVAVSLYLPTQTHGRETRQNPIMLKNLLRQVSGALAERNLPESGIEALLAPAAQLIDDYDFWQHQDEGLVIFLSDDGLRMQKLPVRVPERAVIGTAFHIAPLLPLLAKDADYVVLALTADATQVLQGTRTGLTATQVPDMPASIEAIDNNTDYEGPLQSHGFGRPNTGGQSMPKTQVYGDSPEEWRKGLLVVYARRAASALAAFLSGEPKPVVVIADAEIGGHVRNDVQLAPMVAGFVEVNPATLDEDGLRAAARDVIEPLQDEKTEDALDLLQALRGRGDRTASFDPADIVTAALEGRIGRLFVARETVHQETAEADARDGDHKVLSGSLDQLDEAARLTLRNGGEVLLVGQERLPDSTAMAAVFRY
jgi:hypothetical protein